MIIQSLSAENLLKYRRLELTNLPTKGIIAISGCNESGKSSIGEAICFALFGRTFAVKPDEIQKLIRWGESRCSVTIGLGFINGTSYLLTRSLDREHNHSARLSHTGESERHLARGKVAVAEALRDLLGYDFESFVDSFYLAQREITTPHPQGHAIHVMAGIAPLAICNKELLEDTVRDQTALAGLTHRNAELATQITDIAFDSQRTHILAADQTDLANRERDIRVHQQTLTEAAAAYQKRESRRQRDAANLIIFARLRLLTFLLGLISIGSWTALALESSHPIVVQVLAWLNNKLPIAWLLYAGLTSLGVSVLSWIRVVVLNKCAKALCTSGKHLAAAMAALDAIEIGLPKILRPSPFQGNGHSQWRLEPEKRTKLRQHLPTGQVLAAEIQNAVAKDDAWIEQILIQIAKRQSGLHQDIRLERERRRTYDNLTGMGIALKGEETELQHRIQLRVYANELLQGAMRHLSHRFNHHLRGLAGRTLPMFTENRYQHLQIDEDLTIRTFSNEKRDFMELDEVSSGTQRQMMLALRLSLSQQLVDRVVSGNQFSFLDEPFAFFDEARTRSTLAALPRLSDNITQIWIVAQQFPTDIIFERSIQCQRDRDEYSDIAKPLSPTRGDDGR